MKTQRNMAAAVQILTFHLTLSLLLGSSSSDWPPAPEVSSQLSLCQLVNHTVSLEKNGCPTCHPVETTICSGHCKTKDPIIKIHNVHQHVCMYQDVQYKTFHLPDCPPGVDPTVTYPVAVSCSCSRCALHSSDCTFESLQPDFCMNDILFYY